MILHKILEIFLRILFIPLTGGKFFDCDKIPKTGACILYSNHISLWDPFMMHYACLPRIPKLMAKVQLFKLPLIRGAIKSMGAFPVDRGHGDTAAIRTACEVLREGEILGIYPEGTRVKTGEIGEFKPGTAMIASRANVPMIPMYVHGKYRLFAKPRFVIGDPFTLEDIQQEKGIGRREALRVAAEVMREKILELKEIAEKL